MARVHHVASYKRFPDQGIWCLKLNDELLLMGYTSWRHGMYNLVGTLNRIRQGDVPGNQGDFSFVNDFFNHHIRPVLEVSEFQINFHPSDIPKVCAEFWRINCVLSYEEIDTRREKWWKYLREDGPFKDVAEDFEQGNIIDQNHLHLLYRKDFDDYEE